MWKSLADSGRVPPALIKERFCMKLEQDDYVAAVSSITGHHMKELPMPLFSKVAWLNLLTKNAGRFRTNSLVRLMHEVTLLVARTDMPNPVLQNLVASCQEFLKNNVTVSEIGLTQIATATPSEVALKSWRNFCFNQIKKRKRLFFHNVLFLLILWVSNKKATPPQGAGHLGFINLIQNVNGTLYWLE